VAAAFSARSRGVAPFSEADEMLASVLPASSSINCARSLVLDLYTERRGRAALPATFARTRRCRTSRLCCFCEVAIDFIYSEHRRTMRRSQLSCLASCELLRLHSGCPYLCMAQAFWSSVHRRRIVRPCLCRRRRQLPYFFRWRW